MVGARCPAERHGIGRALERFEAAAMGVEAGNPESGEWVVAGL